MSVEMKRNNKRVGDTISSFRSSGCHSRSIDRWCFSHSFHSFWMFVSLSFLTLNSIVICWQRRRRVFDTHDDFVQVLSQWMNVCLPLHLPFISRSSKQTKLGTRMKKNDSWNQMHETIQWFPGEKKGDKRREVKIIWQYRIILGCQPLMSLNWQALQCLHFRHPLQKEDKKVREEGRRLFVHFLSASDSLLFSSLIKRKKDFFVFSRTNLSLIKNLYPLLFHFSMVFTFCSRGFFPLLSPPQVSWLGHQHLRKKSGCFDYDLLTDCFFFCTSLSLLLLSFSLSLNSFLCSLCLMRYIIIDSRSLQKRDASKTTTRGLLQSWRW